jgi:hypothetical protein
VRGVGRWKADRRQPAWFFALAVIAVAPLFVAVGVQAAHDWRPVSDDAAVATLAHDVLSTRTPLVGMPSTIGLDAAAPEARNEHTHHPGPMMFWALAVPERLSGSSPIGVLVGTALVNATALITIGLVVARLLGPRAAVGALSAAEILVWALGRQWIVDPWNPYIALLPLLALCVLAWAAAAGRSQAVIGVVIFGSFVSQTHLIYAPIAAALFAAAIACTAHVFWRRARRGNRWRRDASITAGVALATLAALWALPLYDQLAHSPGNLSAVARSFERSQGKLVGLDWALRLQVQTIGAPPLFARQGGGIATITRSWSSLGPLRVLSASAVVIALGLALVFAVRRRDRISAAGAAIALVSLAVSTVVVSRVPVYFDGAPIYRILQVWPIGCFVWITVAVCAVREIEPRIRRREGTRLPPARTVAFATAVVWLAIAPVAIAFADSARRDDARAAEAVDLIANRVAPRLVRGVPYEFEMRTQQLFIGGGVENGLFRELARRGFDARVPSSDDYLGRSHAAPPGAAKLVVCSGRKVVVQLAPGIEELASVSLATRADVDRMRRLDAELHAFLATPANLTRRGRAALRGPASDEDALVLRGLLDAGNDPQRANHALVAIAHELVRTHDPVFDRLRVADAAAHDLVDQYVFRVYLIRGSSLPGA